MIKETETKQWVGLALSPSGRLHLEEHPETEPANAVSPVLAEKIQTLFAQDSLQGLLHLGLTAWDSPLPPSVAFWRELSQCLLNRVCQFARSDAENSESWKNLPPPVAELQALLDQAPVMPGVEYLNSERMSEWWQALLGQLAGEVEGFNPPRLSAYLDIYHLGWNKIGRVCFHLAENKTDSRHPFAFLATYAAGLSKAATLQHWPLGRALQEYAGESRRAQLLALLLPIQKAAENCVFIKKLVDSQAVFQPLAWSSKEAYQFLQAVPQMEAAGIVVRIPNWWNVKRPPRPQVNIKIGEKNPNQLGFDALLDFDAYLTLPNGEKLTPAELKQILKARSGLVHIKGQWITADSDQLSAVLSHWQTLERQARRKGLSWAEGLRALTGTRQFEDKLAAETVAEYSHVVEGDWLRKTLHQLRQPSQAVDAETLQCQLKPFLNATLRPYQQTGVAWLWRLYQLRLGGCLADDMGLGKTLQVLALLLLAKYHRPVTVPVKKNHLLIVPTSLLGNWQMEIHRFTPSLNVSIAHASAQKNRHWDFSEIDLVITTYGTLARIPQLTQANWDIVILDEAQSIKNPAAQQTQAIKALSSQVRFILTGTPVENRLMDLWSLFDFAAPGLLGSSRAFADYAKNENFHATVRRLVSPYILRRLKSDKQVIADLPDKTEIDAYCSLSKSQIAAYQQTVEALAEQLNQKEIGGIARRGLVLSTLLRLKQICNHPSQWLGHGEYSLADSGKLLRLQELATTIAAQREKVLVFTQFREIIPALHDCLSNVFQRAGLMLHGQTSIKQRTQAVEAFQQESGPPFFVLSLKAGGTGLTLTAAAHVIHFDRWWNPAVENQATDRAYRIGQKKNVLVHKFICTGTIEEKIDALIRSKKILAEELLSSQHELNLTELSNDALLDIMTLDIHKALGESS